jgi:hypothetical protein
MGVPQQPELRRSRRSPVDPESFEEHQLHEHPGADPASGPVPPANRPGRHPAKEQDKPRELGGAGHGRAE